MTLFLKSIAACSRDMPSGGLASVQQDALRTAKGDAQSVPIVSLGQSRESELTAGNGRANLPTGVSPDRPIERT